MKNLKDNLMKIPTLLMLVVSIFMTLPFNAFALSGDDTGTITISGVEDSATVNAYRLMTVNIDANGQPKDPVYTWVDEVAGWVRNHYSNYIAQNSNRVTDLFNENAGDVAKFYAELATAIRTTGDGGISINPTKTGTGSTPITELPMGNYFVLIEGGLKIYRPIAVNLVPVWQNNAWVMTEATAEAKASEPTIDKNVVGQNADDDKIQGEIGKELTFTIDVNVPEFPLDAISKSIVISDTFEPGLTFNGDTVKVFGDTTLLSEGVNYSIVKNATGFTVTIDKTKNSDNVEYYETIRNYSNIHIEYKGTINEKAVVTTGTKNNATLQYSNNPYQTTLSEPKTDEVTVYTYGIKVNKLDENGNGLPGAIFSISTSNSLDNALSFIKTGDGVYRLAKVGEQGDTNLTVSTVDGTLEVVGLALGDYYIIEVEAPKEYIKIESPIPKTIADADLDGKADDNRTTGYVTVPVTNSKLFVLPVTGGMGTLIFSVTGIVFMGAAAFLIKNILKKENE